MPPNPCVQLRGRVQALRIRRWDHRRFFVTTKGMADSMEGVAELVGTPSHCDEQLGIGS